MSIIPQFASNRFPGARRTPAAASDQAALRRLIRMLSGDTGRPRPPITLAGPRSNGGSTAQQAPPSLPDAPPVWTGTPRGHGSRTMPGGAEPTAADGEGPYSHAQLVKMDNKFRARLLQAFKLGKESREAASASGSPPPARRPSVIARAISCAPGDEHILAAGGRAP
jgi:hypothetical protein